MSICYFNIQNYKSFNIILTRLFNVSIEKQTLYRYILSFDMNNLFKGIEAIYDT